MSWYKNASYTKENLDYTEYRKLPVILSVLDEIFYVIKKEKKSSAGISYH